MRASEHAGNEALLEAPVAFQIGVEQTPEDTEQDVACLQLSLRDGLPGVLAEAKEGAE